MKQPTLKAIEQKKAQLVRKREELKEGLPFLYGHKWYAWQRGFFKSRDKLRFLTAANQIGKALQDDTLIPTPDGFRRIADLCIGDFVFGRDGKPTRIIAIPFKGITPCVEFTFDDGSTVVSSEDHLWVCKSGESRFRKEIRGKANLKHDQWQVVTTKDIVSKGGYKPGAVPRRRFSIPFCEAPEHGRKDLFDPYLVGLAIGNGGLSSGSVTITTADPFVSDYLIKNYSAKVAGKYGYRLNGLVPKFRELGLMGKTSHQKRIPLGYLEASVAERKAILSGLMDTDGSIFGKCAMEYCTTSEGLKDDFLRLAYSLGGTCKVIKRAAYYRDGNGNRVQCRDAYRIRPKFSFNPFRTPAKACRWYEISRRHEKLLYEAKPLGTQRATCITVENDDGTFLCTEKYIVTHNSQCQIWDKMHRATAIDEWEKLWPVKPDTFWYLYPTQDIVNQEWRTKFLPWMPKGLFKESAQYGWKLDASRNEREIKGIIWNSGVYLEFKTYNQNVHALQGGSIDDIGCDEEMPEELWDEIIQRTKAKKGYFSMVFTATRNQQFWRRVMEGPEDLRLLPDAFKLQVTKYDCLHFDDGTKGLYTEEEIQTEIAQCRSKAEIDRRIYGRFVTEVGRKYPTYDPVRHYCKPFKIPPSYKIYSGVDVGAGGNDNHPASITFIAVAPDYRKGYVYKGWRGDTEVTTAGDVLNKYVGLRGTETCIEQRYDYHSKDFGMIAERSGEPFLPADKSHERGEEVINTLFANDMIQIFDTPELNKLGGELLTLMRDTDKRKAKDDFADSFRYAVISIPWDWTAIQGIPSDNEVEAKKKAEAERLPTTPAEALAEEIRMRRGETPRREDNGWAEFEDEIGYWNSLYSGD